MNEFFNTYDRYKKRYHLKSIVQTSIRGDNHIRIWQERSVSESRLIVDVTAETEEELYMIATDQLVRYFEIFG